MKHEEALGVRGSDGEQLSESVGVEWHECLTRQPPFI